MTRWTEFPLRRPGAAWPGIDTKGGRLDNGTGQLTDRSVNCTINRSDLLEKRKGFVRGLNERFSDVVCGLHRYTDNCGREWLLVADADEIKVREPFALPVFETDDAYPNDSFAAAGPDQDLWRNVVGYTNQGGQLRRTGAELSTPFPRASYLRWFKDASNRSYQVELEYVMHGAGPTPGPGACSIALRGNGSLTSGAYVFADLRFAASLYTITGYFVNALGDRQQLFSGNLAGSLTNVGGFFRLTYQRLVIAGEVQGRLQASVTPLGAALQEFQSGPLTEAQDRDLGLVTGIGCTQQCGITVVGGGPV